MGTENKLSLVDYAAYIPCYDNGNSVIFIKKDGEKAILNRSIKSVMDRIFRENSHIIQYVKRNMPPGFTGMRLVPVPISIEYVLIPVKMRKTIGKNDGCYGYVNIYSIKGVQEVKMTIITLSSGTEISCLDSPKTVTQRISRAKQLSEMFSAQMLGEYKLKEGTEKVFSEYSQAATKGDITMLAYEIMKLRESFNKKGGFIYEKEKRQKKL